MSNDVTTVAPSGMDAVRDNTLTLGPTGRPRVDFPPIPHGVRITPAHVLSVVNQKGGVGKTTTTISLGACLAEAGLKVLLVDLDPQGALSAGLGINPHSLTHTIYDLLIDADPDPAEVITSTCVEGLDLLPANIDLSAAEVQLMQEVGRERVLERALAPVRDEYDIILIDCQPSLGLLTINALACSDGVLVPLAAEYFAMRGVALLVDTITKVQKRINPKLKISGILATLFDGRTKHTREVMERMIEAFGDQVFHTVIARTVRFPEGSAAGEPITVYAPTSTSAAAYRTLAREVVHGIIVAAGAAAPTTPAITMPSVTATAAGATTTATAQQPAATPVPAAPPVEVPSSVNAAY